MKALLVSLLLIWNAGSMFRVNSKDTIHNSELPKNDEWANWEDPKAPLFIVKF